MKVGIIILAAGRGERFNGKKQDIIFHGKALWQHSLDTALSVVNRENIIVVGKDVGGGNTRSESVRNGLDALDKKTDRVVIVEAARPLLTVKQLNVLIYDSSDSVSFVSPLVNTPIGRDGTYYNRSEMYDLLVPQAFNYQMLSAAYQTNKYLDMTDETRVMYEEYGIKPRLIETTQNLFKVTYPQDIVILEEIYQRIKDDNNV